MKTDRLLVFTLLIPLTDDRTGLAHPPKLFDDWMLSTAEKFGGITQLAANLRGLWFDSQKLVQDRNNWYKIAVPREQERELVEHARRASVLFGQRCIYFERAGEAELVFPHTGPSV